MANQLQEKMFRHVEQWRNSGLSKKAYALSHGMSRYKFEYWIRKSSDERCTNDGKPDFVEIVKSPQASIAESLQKQSTENLSPKIVLTFPSGLSLQIFG